MVIPDCLHNIKSERHTSRYDPNLEYLVCYTCMKVLGRYHFGEFLPEANDLLMRDIENNLS